MSAKIAFDSTVTSSGNNTGMVVPDEVIKRLGAGRRPAVIVNVNGYEFRSTVGVMGGKHMLSISAAIRKETGLQGDDAIQVTLMVANGPREVGIPSDLAEALAAEPAVSEYFSKLSNSVQRYHVDNINVAKSAATRQRRIERAITLFRDGRPR